MFWLPDIRHILTGQNISHEALVNPIRLCGFSKVNMAAVEGSLEEEALRRRERLKAMRIKSGLPEQQVLDTLWTFLFFLIFLFSVWIKQLSQIVIPHSSTVTDLRLKILHFTSLNFTLKANTVVEFVLFPTTDFYW